MISVLDIPLKDLNQSLVMEMYKAKLPFRLENGGFLHYEGSLQPDVYNRPAPLFPAFGTVADKEQIVYKPLLKL